MYLATWLELLKNDTALSSQHPHAQRAADYLNQEAAAQV
jgi:hypothetical protein